MTRPTLTAIIPNYNHGSHVTRAIEAIAEQSRPPDELLILDDASTDNSIDVIEACAARYPFLRLIRNERNLGVLSSLNNLVSQAKGDYLYSGAADDYILPGFFERAMDMAQRHPEAGVICGQQVIMGPDGEEISVARVRSWSHPVFATPATYLREYLFREHVTHSLSSATLFRRDALNEVGGFRREVGPFSDVFAIHAVALKCGACYVPERFAAWKMVESGFSRSECTDPEVLLNIAANGAQLMRSPEFRDRFPERFARWWRRGLEREALNYYIWTLREPPRTSLLGLWKGRLLKRYLFLKVALAYRGDAAAFIRDQ